MHLARPLAALVALWLVGPALGQTLTTNDEGERIVVYPDGSWRYFSEPPPPAPDSSAAELPLEREAYTSPTLSAEAEARARAIVRQRTEQQRKTASRMRRTLDKRVRDQAKAGERVDRLRREGTDRDELEEATRRHADATQLVGQLNGELAALEERIRHLERTIPMTREQRTGYLVDVGLEATPAPRAATAATPAAAPQRPRSRPAATPALEYRAYDRRRDPRVNPPRRDCLVAREGVDEFTKKRRRELAAETFFAYTSDDLRRSLGGEDLITARGRLIENGGDLSFAVTYVIRSAYASREFGALPRGAALSLKLVGGGSVELRNAKLAQGEYDPVDKVTRYEARYPIDKTAAKTLSRRYLDGARVTWGTGFEDYPLYDIDYFRRMLACL